MKNSATITVDLLPRLCLSRGLFLIWALLMLSEEVVAGAQILGAPDARVVRRRRLRPRSDSRLANPRGAMVRFAPDRF